MTEKKKLTKTQKNELDYITQHKVDEYIDPEEPIEPDAVVGTTAIGRASLFVKKTFRMHAGGIAHYKIECDALIDNDLETLAFIISEKAKMMTMGTMEGHGISRVIGVPRGGIRLANALAKYVTPGQGVTVIVDDVLTTGTSMEEAKRNCGEEDAIGVVIFARGKCPDWIFPIFSMNWFNTKDD